MSAVSISLPPKFLFASAKKHRQLTTGSQICQALNSSCAEKFPR